MHYAYADADGTLRVSSEVESFAHSASDKFSVRQDLISTRYLQKRNQVVIQLCMTFLKESNIVFPTKVTKMHVLLNWRKVLRLLKGRNAEDLIQLPSCGDAQTAHACQFLYMMATVAWLSVS